MSIQRYTTFTREGSSVIKRDDDGELVFHSAHANDLAAMRLRAEKAEATLAKFAAIGKQIAEQDNRSTDKPIFLVQQKVTDSGYEDDYAEHVMWVIDGREADTDERNELEDIYQGTGDIPDGWTRTGCRDRWEFVTACFTSQACNDHITANGHNLREPRIYADHSCRNFEFRELWDLMVGLHRDQAKKAGEA